MYKALLVDDEKWILESLKGTVDWRSLGFEVVGEAMNGLEGFERIRDLRPDVAFIDIRMPGMNGIELIGKLKEVDVPAKFIVASGYAEFEYAKQAMIYGAVGYCLKPFRKEEIVETLTAVRETIRKERQALHNEPGTDAADPSGKETFSLIVRYIHEHFHDNLSIQDIAKQFYMHPNYLSSLFKKELRINFTKYLTDLRMQHASELLRSTQLPVSDVAEQVGYNDYFYFAKMFKKHSGKTPTDYRIHGC